MDNLPNPPPPPALLPLLRQSVPPHRCSSRCIILSILAIGLCRIMWKFLKHVDSNLATPNGAEESQAKEEPRKEKTPAQDDAADDFTPNPLYQLKKFKFSGMCSSSDGVYALICLTTTISQLADIPVKSVVYCLHAYGWDLNHSLQCTAADGVSNLFEFFSSSRLSLSIFRLHL